MAGTIAAGTHNGLGLASFDTICSDRGTSAGALAPIGRTSEAGRAEPLSSDFLVSCNAYRVQGGLSSERSARQGVGLSFPKSLPRTIIIGSDCLSAPRDGAMPRECH